MQASVKFSKYQGAGNDFILIDHRAPFFSPHLVPKLCHRKFGIGADGLILLELDPIADFRMRIFNSDGSEASSCGNGLRCLLRFIADLGFPRKVYKIATGERTVQGGFKGDKIWVQLGKALHLKQLFIEGYEVYSLDTGVPHVVLFSPDADLKTLGPLLRHHELFQPEGTNVNIASMKEDGSIHVRTYERGVEGETLSCGTGAAAVGVVASQKYNCPNPIQISSEGAQQGIELQVEGLNVTLIGDALKVFEGQLSR